MFQWKFFTTSQVPSPSRPSGRGLSTPQITSSTYGSAVKPFWESASLLLTSLWYSHYMKENTGKQWSNIEKKIEERIEWKRRCEKRRNRGNEHVGVRVKWEIRQREKGTSFWEFIEFYTTWGFIKCRWIVITLLLVCDVWRDALIIPEAFGLGEC